MGRTFKKSRRLASAGRERLRLWVQIAFAAATNGYWKGFVEGRIYTGPSKSLCLPGLNCYSCPGALGSCPIGSLQAVLASRNFSFSFYLTGFFLLVGTLLGRIVCGWFCPFGLLQDLLHRIPFLKKIKRVPGDRALRYMKYGILLIFVILLPMFVVDIVGQGEPWFCKWICPSGTLMAGWPLVFRNEGIRQAAGLLFLWKNAILFLLIFLSLIIYRPFCKYICPLGAIYGLFNRFSFIRLRIDQSRCVHCHACTRACKMNVQVEEDPDSMECIRCGSCVSACGQKALAMCGSSRFTTEVNGNRSDFQNSRISK